MQSENVLTFYALHNIKSLIHYLKHAKQSTQSELSTQSKESTQSMHQKSLFKIQSRLFFSLDEF